MWFLLGFGISLMFATIMNFSLIRLLSKTRKDIAKMQELYNQLELDYAELKKLFQEIKEGAEAYRRLQMKETRA